MFFVVIVVVVVPVCLFVFVWDEHRSSNIVLISISAHCSKAAILHCGHRLSVTRADRYPRDEYDLMFGFPHKPISSLDQTANLSDCGLARENIHVQSIVK